MEIKQMKMKNVTLLTFLLLLIVLTSCIFESEDEKETIGKIAGVVKDAATSQPINSVNVSIPNGKSTTTNSTGQYSFDNLDAKEYVLHFNKADYLENNQTITVTPGNTTTADVQLIPETPIMTISPDILNFGSDSTTKTITISNSGTGELTWSIAPTEAWLSITPMSGSVTTGSSPATVTIDKTGMSYGNHSATITITSNANSKTIEALVIIPDPNGLQLTAYPTNLDFGDTTTEMELNISNSGVGMLTWSLVDDAPWLSCSPSSGTVETGFSNVIATVNRLGLSPGEYTGNILINSDGGSQNISVTMDVSDQPLLLVQPGSIDFGVGNSEMNLTITNTGSEPLNWTLAPNQTWINASSSSGSLSSESENITISVDRAGLDPNEYTGNIFISSNGGNQNVGVQMIVQDSSSPMLNVSADELDFGSTSELLTFVIQNIGSETLTWDVSTEQNWIEILPSNGATNEAGSANITVSVDKTGLTNGIHNGMINVTSNGGSHQVAISMFVTAAQLGVNPENLNFGSENTQMTITINNSGDETLNWSLASDQTWLSASSTSGSLNNEPENIIIFVERDDLDADDYSGNIAFTSNGGNQTLAIQMSVSAGSFPELNVSADELDFGSLTSELSFVIQNYGSEVLTWDVSTEQNWIDISPINGATNEAGSANIAVSVDRSGLSNGVHNGMLNVNSNGGSHEVDITMYVTAAQLSVNPTELNFGSANSDLNITLTNSGDEALNWSLNPDQTWITASSTSGTILNDPENITISIDRSGLDPADYSGSIAISSNGGNQNVSISMVVEANPVLEFSPTLLNFGEVATQNSFTISNLGNGYLNWTLTPNYDWISVDQVSGSTTNSSASSINVTVDRDGLFPGSYSGVVALSSDGGSGNIDIVLEMPQPYEQEVNNSFVQANTLNLNSSIMGNIGLNNNDQYDWFKFTFPASGQFFFSVRRTSPSTWCEAFLYHSPTEESLWDVLTMYVDDVYQSPVFNAIQGEEYFIKIEDWGALSNTDGRDYVIELYFSPTE